MRTGYAAFKLAQWLSEALPPSQAFRLAEWTADTHGRGSAADRAAVTANLAALGVDPSEARVREVFRNFGRYLVEFFTMHRSDSAVVVDGASYLDDIRRRRCGAIILTAHVGNWELGAVVLKRMGVPLTVVALQHDDPGTNALFDRQRRRCGLEVVPLGAHAARQCLQRLREGRMIGLLGDREFGRNGVSASFLGQPLTLPKGPAVLSLRAQAPIVPTFLIREGRGAFRLCIEPPLWPGRAAGVSAVGALTQRYAGILERYLTRYPEQWLMFRPILSASAPVRRTVEADLPAMGLPG